MASISLLNFSFCLCIVFLISLSTFGFLWLPKFKWIIVNTLSESTQISISLGLVFGALLISLDDVMPAWVNLNAGSTGADPALGITEVGPASGS